MSKTLGLALVVASLIGPVAPAHAAPAGCGTPTPAALAGFFDGTLPGLLARDRVPGAVVSVVAGGGTAFGKGYGSADLAGGVAFDPDRTLVRIASITKLFTWTAVMQQVEAGRLDLDADVNRYLDGFAVPATYPAPVTLRTLMDHTSGFEERVIGTGARDAAGVPPLREYLADNMPARIRPPGEISAYSNYGAALAGYVVTRVSGQPYDAYVRDHLFTPLGMARSTATEPVPAELAGDLAGSYDSTVDPPVPVPFTFDRMPPDGAISSTATDMATFMLAHLDGSGGRILAPPTAARMRQRSFAADPRLGGYAHGFMARPVGGHPVLMHDGSWEGFQSALVLVPGCDLGVFVSTNGTGGIDTLTDLVPAFLDRFAAAGAAAPATPAAATAEPAAGFYKPTRHNESTVEKLLVLLGPARLRVDGEGTVHFKGGRWRPQGDGLYQRDDGSDHLVFRAGAGGRVYVATDGPAYELMPRGETLPVNLAVLLGFTVVAVTALAVPVAALWRRLRRRAARGSARWRAARTLAAAAAGAGLFALVGLGAAVSGDTGDYLYGAPLSFRLLLAVPVAALVAAAAAGVLTVWGWRGAGAGAVARVHQVVLFAGLGGFAWFLWQWNLLGWQL
jgi:CubicO group peptidase (beta-lactamase class C family)